MMTLGSVPLAILALVIADFDGSQRAAQACSCMDTPLCDSYRGTDIVLRAKAVSMTVSSNSDMPAEFGGVTYTVKVITTYEEGDGETYGEGSEVIFTTEASSSLCGISMNIGADAEGNEYEYLLGLNRHASSNELRAELCGVFMNWSYVDVPLLESCASTPSPSQVIKAEGDTADSPPDDSSALGVIVSRVLFAAWFVGCLILL